MSYIQVEFENSKEIKFLLDEILDYFDFKENNNVLMRKFYESDEFIEFEYIMQNRKFNNIPYTTIISLD